jgi:hypothetical protein
VPLGERSSVGFLEGEAAEEEAQKAGHEEALKYRRRRVSCKTTGRRLRAGVCVLLIPSLGNWAAFDFWNRGAGKDWPAAHCS